MGGVVPRQVGVDGRIAQVVDGDDLQVVLLAALVMCAQDIAADAPVAVDGDFDGHDAELPRLFNPIPRRRVVRRATAAGPVAPAGSARHGPGRVVEGAISSGRRCRRRQPGPRRQPPLRADRLASTELGTGSWSAEILAAYGPLPRRCRSALSAGKSHKVWRNNRRRSGTLRAMATPRFFVPDPSRVRLHAASTTVALPAAAAHHARRVLRLRPDDRQWSCSTARAMEYAAALRHDGADPAARTGAHLARRRRRPRGARAASRLSRSLSAQDKIDWLIEKCVELGVARIVSGAGRTQRRAPRRGTPRAAPGALARNRRWRRRRSAGATACSRSCWRRRWRRRCAARRPTAARAGCSIRPPRGAGRGSWPARAGRHAGLRRRARGRFHAVRARAGRTLGFAAGAPGSAGAAHRDRGPGRRERPCSRCTANIA